MAAAVLIHAGFLFAALGTARGGLISSRGGQRTGMEDAVFISLAGIPGVRTKADAEPRPPAPEASALAQLLRRVAMQTSALPISAAQPPAAQPSDLEELMKSLERERLDRQGSSGASNQDLGGEANAGSDVDIKEAASGDRSARTPGPSAQTASTGDLWGQVEPCWKRAPGRSGTPVTLDVQLDQEGRIALPPRILRSRSGAPAETILVSEARAIAAIMECVPYKPGGLRRLPAQYRITFATTK